MNLENYGRQLLDVLADRSLELLRSAQVDDVRRLVRGELPTALTQAPSTETSTLGRVGAALGIFAAGAAVGAGVAVLTTPSSGAELRKQIRKASRSANQKVRKEAGQLRSEVEHHIDDARTAVMSGVEQVSTAVGLSAPTKTSTRRKTLNGHVPARRAKKAASRRVAHA